MLAVVGRRRVGKTFLIQTVYENRIDFEITGIQDATRKEQLQNFMLQLGKFAKGSFPITEPKNWLEAFSFLTQYLEMKQKEEKIVVFLDELPWLATHRSGFLKGLSYFWNSWAGYTFESICLKHLPQIKQKLGISGVFTTASAFVKKGTEEEKGTQID